MNDTKKRTRAPKKRTLEEVWSDALELSLVDKLKLHGYVAAAIESEKKSLEGQLELIKENMK
jgi:hypothetical protein